MKNAEKFLKIIKATANAIQAKDNSTDLLYHLQKEFKEYKDIKRLFNSEFDKDFLKSENILKEEKSEIDKRKVEYRLDELHKLFKNYVKLCEKYTNINCKKAVIKIIVDVFIKCSTYAEYDILKKIENELKNILLPRKEIDRNMLGFSPPYVFTEYSEERFFLNEIEQVKNLLDLEKLDLEIEFILKILKNSFNR